MNQNDLDHYRAKVKRRSAGMAVYCLTVMAVEGMFLRQGHMTEYLSAVTGFMAGTAAALAVYLVNNFRVLRNETLLKRQMNFEKDERMAAIRAKAGMPMLLYTSCAMLLAGLIAGCFNLTVFMTLWAAALVQLLVGVAVKLVYTRRM